MFNLLPAMVYRILPKPSYVKPGHYLSGQFVVFVKSLCIFFKSRVGEGFRHKQIEAGAAVCSSSCPAVPWFVGLAQTRSLRCSGQTQTNTPQPLLFLNKKSTSQQNPSHLSNPICCRVPQAVTKHGWRDLRETGKSPLCKSWIPAGSRGNCFKAAFVSKEMT